MALSLDYLFSDKKNLETDCHNLLEDTPSAFFQQTLEWRNVINSLGTDKSVYILVKDNNKIVGLLPIYIFNSPFGNIINNMPYPGPLGGVLIKDNLKYRQKAFKILIDGLNKLALSEKCVLATIISSPFKKDDKLYRKFLKPDWELENYTLFMDLNKPRITTSHFRNNLQRMIKKAKKKSYTVGETKRRKDLEAWYRIHSKRHKQINLEPLPKQVVLGALKYLVPQNKANFFVIKKNKHVVAGCLVAYHKDIMDTYIISGDKESYKNGAIYLLVNHVIEWANKKGFKIFNWQSSKPRGGGPYNFKMQWGSKESPYFFFTKKYGPIDNILNLGVEGIKKHYKWHFVLPYSELK